MCSTFEGLGTLGNYYKYIERLICLYEHHFVPVKKTEYILSQVNFEEKNEVKDLIIGFDKTLDVIVTEISN